MFVHLAVQQILIFSGTALTISRTLLDLSEINVFDKYYSFCPYNNFCSKNATNIRNSNEMHLTGCCEECSCDRDCQIFGICCPDYTLVDDIDVKYPCVDLDSYFNAPKGINEKYFDDLKYHIIDDCQKSMAYSTHCENSTLLEDFIFVTDIKTGRIYKNKHCALCHGVDEYEEWGIFTSCEEIDELRFDTFEERDKYVVKYCPIIPYPPASQATSLYRCKQVYHQAVIEECKQSNDTREVSESIENACERHYPYTNGAIRVGKDWYKNIFCIWCINKFPTIYSHLCEKPSIPESIPRFTPFTMLLSLKRQITSERSKQCNESSIFDPNTDSCLQLYCPPGSIPNFGKCSSVSEESTGIYIAMVFMVELNGSVENYYDELRRNFKTIMTSIVGDEISCGYQFSEVIKMPTYIYPIFAVSTKGNCNRDFLISYLWKLLNDSLTIEFTHLNETVEVKLTTSVVSQEMVRPVDVLHMTMMPVWHNVLRICPRIDRRMLPMLARMNLDTMFQGKVIDNKICVRDYFKYAELMNNAMNALKQYTSVLILNILVNYGLK